MTLAFRRYEGRKKTWNDLKEIQLKTIAARTDVVASSLVAIVRCQIFVIKGPARELTLRVPRLQDLPQSRVVGVVDSGIEQRPRLSADQQRGHRGDHQVAIIPVFD